MKSKELVRLSLQLVFKFACSPSSEIPACTENKKSERQTEPRSFEDHPVCFDRRLYRYQTAVKYVENACGNLLISSIFFHCKQITVFHISSEEHQDIDVAILRALLKGW